MVVVGDSNVLINKRYEELFTDLNILHRKVLNNKQLSDEEKLNISSDIESLKNQLTKTTPDKSIVQKLWSGISASVTFAEFTSLVYKIGSQVTNYF